MRLDADRVTDEPGNQYQVPGDHPRHGWNPRPGGVGRICVNSQPDTTAALRDLAVGHGVSGTEMPRIAMTVLRTVEAEVRDGDLLAMVERHFRGRRGAVRELELSYLKPIREMTSAELAVERAANPDSYFKQLSAETCAAALADVHDRDRRLAAETRRRWLRRLIFGWMGGEQ